MTDLRLMALTHLIAAGCGYAFAPHELLETEVVHNGFFETDTKRVLATAVESLRSENKLLVYSFKGFASVSVERDGLLFLDGRQDLIVPAAVGYYVDLSRLTLADLTYDERTRVVTVSLPRLVLGDVAFEPEAARVINGGMLTFSQKEVEVLTRLNYTSARRAFIKQAQQPTLVAAVKSAAVEQTAALLKLPLRMAGRPDVKVVAEFGSD